MLVTLLRAFAGENKEKKIENNKQKNRERNGNN